MTMWARRFQANTRLARGTAPEVRAVECLVDSSEMPAEDRLPGQVAARLLIAEADHALDAFPPERSKAASEKPGFPGRRHFIKQARIGPAPRTQAGRKGRRRRSGD